MTPQQAERFYYVWRRVLRYVNQLKQIAEPFHITDDHLVRITGEQSVIIRDVLWADDSPLDDYVRDNPDDLAQADLDVVRSWKQRVQGKFVVVRATKTHTFFLHGSGDTEVVYGVKGLQRPLEELCQFMPCYVEAVLLPFDKEITYDGLFRSYPVHVGSNMTASMKQAIHDAEERGAILCTLQSDQTSEANPEALKQSVDKAHAAILREFQRQLTSTSLSMKVIERDLRHVERLLDSMARHTPPSRVHNLSWQDIEGDLQLSFAFLTRADYKQVLTAHKRFVKFLRETGRMDWQYAYDILEELKMLAG